MKVEIDWNKCTGIGLCESLAPDVFEVDDDGILQFIGDESISAALEPDVEAAIGACPKQALRWAS